MRKISFIKVPSLVATLTFIGFYYCIIPHPDASFWHGLVACEDACHSTLQGPLQGPYIDGHPAAEIKVMPDTWRGQAFFFFFKVVWTQLLPRLKKKIYILWLPGSVAVKWAFICSCLTVEYFRGRHLRASALCTWTWSPERGMNLLKVIGCTEAGHGSVWLKPVWWRGLGRIKLKAGQRKGWWWVWNASARICARSCGP